jgi:pimeloyl-ACP methyl ester carboxylesterase
MTRTRIVALTLIGVVALGLAYLKLGSADDRPSVPAGALAGDLLLEPCTYSTENGSYAADCGTLVVPENRADPQSRLIAVRVTRIRAQTDDPAEPVFRLQGGPGKTNMNFTMASRFAGERDVVLVGYRGIDSSVRLDCPEVESSLKHSTDFLSEKSLLAYADGYRACAARLTNDGVDLAGYTIPQRVDDLEAARVALGYDRINLLSESAGTRTALIYSWRYPESIHRSVLLAVNPPGHFVWDTKTNDEQIERYAELCSQDASCSGRTEDLAATMSSTTIPDDWLFLPIETGTARVGSFYSLVETTPENAPLSSPMAIDTWLAASDGDASGFWFTSLFAGAFFPGEFVWGEYAATARIDAQAASEYFSAGGRKSDLAYAATTFGWGEGRLVDAWPATPDDDAYSEVRTSNTETLLVGGQLDSATPPQWATRDLLPHLPNGRQVVLPGFGHSTSFWLDQQDAGTQLVNTFLDTGQVDDSLYEPQRVDFTPEVTQAALGKGIGGGIVGLAVITVLSLLWMAVRRTPRFGRKKSVLMRSLYPIVLGLGGWFAGVLLVITTMPGVPLDDQRLATLSVGLPVALGIYYAWLNRDWPARTRLTGFVAAVVGGLVGAWLGFQAGADLLALVTAIVGAAVAANLSLIVLDIARGQSVRDRFVKTNAKETLEARPSPVDGHRADQAYEACAAPCAAARCRPSRQHELRG